MQCPQYRKGESMHTSLQLKCLLLEHELGVQSGLVVVCEKTEMTLEIDSVGVFELLLASACFYTHAMWLLSEMCEINS